VKLARRIVAKLGFSERAETGAALVLVAASMTILLGFAAFSVDFGWLYLNGVRIQHGADAAALAGVVYEPDDQATAYSEALMSASENGYVDGLGGTTVTPVDYADDPTAVQNQNQLRVTVTDSVNTFFMKIFGFDTISISRSAVAQYVLPLPMGSDLPYFGEDPSDPSRDPHFWANIHGYYTDKAMGDRYASQCFGNDGSSCPRNSERRQTGYSGGIPATGGYLYGVEVPDGATDLAVEVFDGPFYRTGNTSGDYILAGDQQQSGADDGPTTWFILYAPDPTPLNTSDNEVLCAQRFPPTDSFADFNGDGQVNNLDDQNGDGQLDWADVEIGLPGGVASLWQRLCGTTYSRGPGVYPLRVVIDDPGASDDRGLNRYSLRASTNGAQPRVYGLGDMAVYVNFATNEATLNLAEVQPVHAGKDLVIELWDPDSGNQGTAIIMPDGSMPPCSWNKIGQPASDLPTCNITYASNTFQSSQLEIRVHIPDTYTCSASCWWKIKVTYPSSANDTTTWSAHIEGNPVALVE
jgi:hypothetical protein